MKIVYHKEVVQDGYLLTLEITANVRIPIVKSESLLLKCNSAMLQNMGQNAAILNDGWTLAPAGGVTSFGSQTDINLLNLDFKVRFDESIRNENSPYSGNRLEVIELFVRICDCKPCKSYM